MAAFAPGSDVREVLAAAAWVAGPSLVLWLVASWGRVWLRARAMRDEPEAAAKEPGPSF
jgi:hypothetical protein